MGDERRGGRELIVPAVAVGAAAIVAVVTVKVVRFAVGRLLALWGVAMFALRVVTLRAYRRCPDCRSRIDRRARVCRFCGWRRVSVPSR
jgi:hypothetical protein